MPPPRTWPTAVEIAEDMRDALASQTGDPEIAAVRAMMDGLNRLPWGDTAELAAALERPGSTGDRRWDALLAAAVRHLAAEHGILDQAPAWTLVEPLPEIWHPIWCNAEKARRDLERTPPELARVRIAMDANGFTTA